MLGFSGTAELPYKYLGVHDQPAYAGEAKIKVIPKAINSFLIFIIASMGGWKTQ
jgi:hypothetical protein